MKLIRIITSFALFVFIIWPSWVFCFSPNDTNFGKQWYLRQVSMDQAWDYARGRGEVIVAVIDTGVDITHPDLEDSIWTNANEIPGNNIDDDNNGYIDDIHGWNFINDDNEVTPNFSVTYSEDGIHHGTSIASIIAATGDNRLGIAGAAFGVKLMCLKALDELGNGDSKKAAKAIYYAINNGASVINLSFVGFTPEDELNTAVKRAWEAGITVVAASGNTEWEYGGINLNDYDEYPVCSDQYDKEEYIIGVAATDTLDQKGRFSNFGRACIDVAAPGVYIYSARVYNPEAEGYDKFYNDDWSGTSFAAPIVSGVAALIKSVNPGLGAREINNIIINQGDDIDSINPDYAGELGKRVNALTSVRLAMQIAQNGSDIVIPSPNGFTSYLYKISSQGDVENSFLAFPNFYLGFGAEMGDLNNDGSAEIVVGAGRGGGPQVRVFNGEGRVLGQFFAYDFRFRGGVEAALGDVNGDGKKEIITAPGAGGGPHVLVYDERANIMGNFMAHRADFRGGLKIASGDVNDDGVDEIIVCYLDSGRNYVKIFNKNAQRLGEFDYPAEIIPSIEVMNINQDRQVEILAAHQSGSELSIKAYNMRGEAVREISRKITGSLFDIKSFYDYFNAEERLIIVSRNGSQLILEYLNNNFEKTKEKSLDLK